MFDLGWTEMSIIVLVALVVIGPKDLPKVLRTMGQFMRKARALSREFQSGLNDVMREAELDEARKAVEGTRAGQLDREIRKALDPDGEVDKELRDLDQEARGRKQTPGPPSPAKRHPEPAASDRDPAPVTRDDDPATRDDEKIVKHPAGSSASAKAEPVAEPEMKDEPAETVARNRAQKTG